MHGGLPGARGVNLWIQKGKTAEDGTQGPPKTINIGGKATVKMGAGDRLKLQTPGGGGWGLPTEATQTAHTKQDHIQTWSARGSIADHADRQLGQ